MSTAALESRMPDTIVDFASLIRRNDFATLRDELVRHRPQDLASILSELRPDDQVIAFRILPRRLAASVFEYLSAEDQRALVKAIQALARASYSPPARPLPA